MRILSLILHVLAMWTFCGAFIATGSMLLRIKAPKDRTLNQFERKPYVRHWTVYFG